MNKDHFALYALDCDNVAHKDLALRRTVAKIERLNAENARLREALKPFAKAGELFCIGDEHLDMLIYAPAAGDEYRIVGDDLKRARAALAEKDEM